MYKLNQKIIADLAYFIKMRYGIEVASNPGMLDSFLALQQHLNQGVMDIYFRNHWTPDPDNRTHRTGIELQQRLRDMNPSRVLDVGCAGNEWKKLLGDCVWGIDPHNAEADEQTDILDFHNADIGKYDAVLALGSVNFGDIVTIGRQVSKIVSCAKPGGKIFWRMNPGIKHDNGLAEWIDFFPWSEDHIRNFAAQNNCTVVEIGWDQPENQERRWGNRFYSEWTKN
jgi:hypothetical protein